MTFPQGPIWQKLRQQALDAIPPGARLEFRAPESLATWQAKGSYTISSITASRFAIETAPSDFGGALLSDAAFHLDHALEHQTALMKTLTGGHWSSPAWNVVTVYYWAYYLAMAFSRMVGRTVWFVTPEVAKQFSRLAPKGSIPLSRGTYEISCGATLSLGVRQVNLVKRQRRVHEQLWTTIFDLLTVLHNGVEAGSRSQSEERLFLALINSSKILGDDWPSALRNVVNYRPGFGYTSPRFAPSLESLGYLAQVQTVGGIVDRLEDANLSMRAQPSVETQPKVAARMLVDLTILLSLIAQTLHDEIVDRSGMDRRWLMSKKRFSNHHGLLASGAHWPC